MFSRDVRMIDGTVTSAEKVLTQFLQLSDKSQTEVLALMVNGLGATAQEELFILYRDLHQLCEKQKISIGCRYIGNYATTFGMNGASVSVLKLDQRLRSLLMAPSYSPLVRF